MNTIYLNIKEAEENRIIVTRDNKLVDFEQELQGEESKKGNIYKGVVSNIEPSLEAAFLDFGDGKNGLLPLREIPAKAPGVSAGGLAVGDQLLVQIKKDNIGDKGAGLTSNLSLAGRFLVLRPFGGQDSFGVSSAASSNERKGMSEIMTTLPVPDGMGIIARSMALAHEREDIQWDLESYLLPLWNTIQTAYAGATEPVLIYHENDLLLRVMRDYFRPEEGDIIVCDDEARYNELHALVQILFPDNVGQIHLHSGVDNMVPALVEQKIEQIYTREVAVTSGVRVVFDTTEALVAIDVNSGRQRQGSNIEETALKTNLEAAEIIAEQLRMRNLGGLVVIDFIDMRRRENCDELERRMADLIRKDRARTRMSKISEFGLMEISRQRTSRSLVFSQTQPCPRCSGSGQVWRENTFALHLLRKVRTAAFHDSTRAIVLHTPREVGVFLLNEKRTELNEIEAKSGCDVVIVPDPHLAAPQYKMKPIKGDKKVALDIAKQLTRQEEAAEVAYAKPQRTSTQQPVLKNMLPRERMPSKQTGLGSRLSRVFSTLFGGGSSERADSAPSRGGRNASTRGEGRHSSKQQAQQGKRANSRVSRGGRQRNNSGEGGRPRPPRNDGEGNAVPEDKAADSRQRGNASRRTNTTQDAVAKDKSAAPQGDAVRNRGERGDRGDRGDRGRRGDGNGKLNTAPQDKPPQEGAAKDKSAAPRQEEAAVKQDRSDRGSGSGNQRQPSAPPPSKESALPDAAANGKSADTPPPPKEVSKPKDSDAPAASVAPAVSAAPPPASPPRTGGSASPSSSQPVVLPPIVKKPAAAPTAAPVPPAAAKPPSAPPAPAEAHQAPAGSGWITPGADKAPPPADKSASPQKAEREAG